MKSKKAIGLVFLVLGEVFLLPGIYLSAKEIEFTQKAVKTNALVVGEQASTCRSKHRTYDCFQPVVEYTWNNQKYSNTTGDKSTSHYALGDSLEILVNTKNPNEIRKAGFGHFIACFGMAMIGIIFSTIGLFLFRKALRNSKLARELAESGSVASGLVISCEQIRSIRVNYQHPWLIKAEWVNPLNSQKYVAETLEYIWEEPNVQAGDFVEVRFDQTNPNRCMIIYGEINGTTKNGAA